jgi:general secretion pathway protein F
MTLVSIAVVIFLLIYVVPKIVDVFTQTDAALPLVTQILLGISHFLHEYGLYLLLGLILVGYLFKRQLRHEKFRYRVQQWILRVPIIGKARSIINQARFSSTFGILFAASVPVLDAMRVAADLVTLLPMKEAIHHAISRVREGSSINQALKQTGYFAPMTIHLIANGEKSGQLEQMLTKAAENQNNAVSYLISNLLTLFEPLLIIFMGGIVLFIVLAVLLPIFQLDVIAGQ